MSDDTKEKSRDAADETSDEPEQHKSKDGFEPSKADSFLTVRS